MGGNLEHDAERCAAATEKAPSTAWGSPEWRAHRDDQLLSWFGGNTEAVRFVKAISEITELWDDLVDKDKEITDGQIQGAMIQALIGLPSNTFYAEHMTYLTPLVIAAINAWQDANVLQHGDRNERALAYTLRNLDIQLVQAVVYITQGFSKMRELSPQIWKMFAAEQDDILTWVGETT